MVGISGRDGRGVIIRATVARRHVLERTIFVPRPRPEVWAFFSDPHNLEAITPDFLRFRVETPRPVPTATGTLIDYRLTLGAIPFRWRTRLEDVVPGTSFVDVQLRGPYRRWRHLHAFEDAPGGTRVSDRVEYELPLGPLGSLAHALFVRRALRRIFDHRAVRVAALLGPGAAATPAAR
jgi:ligand-binding SRPBCC domain-containing protein